MLQKLTIKNYALIEELEIDFKAGLTMITGETGSGKSILLGALGLLLGERADSGILRDKSLKCILEARFEISQYQLNNFFTKYDLDYEANCLIRRELSPQGKSRAFINDTPVNLVQLKELGSALVDIHSQHDTLQLKESSFLLKILDSAAKNEDLLKAYSACFSSYKSVKKHRDELIEEEQRLIQEEDFIRFQFNELEELALQEAEEENIESELKVLQHAEDIKSQLQLLELSLDDEEAGAMLALRKGLQAMNAISSYSKEAEELFERLNSSLIELKDIYEVSQQVLSNTEADPQKLLQLEARWDKLNHLFHKHRVGSSAELISLKQSFEDRLQKTESLANETEALQKEVELLAQQLKELAAELSKQRKQAAPKVEKVCFELLKQLGMPNATLSFDFSSKEEADAQGIDRMSFMFSANKGQPKQELSKVASGGEFSRLMLSLKKILASMQALPTIVFDEIDTGVSGAVADKMGEVFESMSQDMQVLAITHLPQIAGKGDDHFKVVKSEKESKTISKLKRLNEQERVEEIASMLSGKNLTEAALSHAKSLLGMSSS